MDGKIAFFVGSMRIWGPWNGHETLKYEVFVHSTHVGSSRKLAKAFFPPKIKRYVLGDGFKIYFLIWRRFFRCVYVLLKQVTCMLWSLHGLSVCSCACPCTLTVPSLNLVWAQDSLHSPNQLHTFFPLRSASTLELAWVRCFVAPAHRTHARCFGHSSKPPKVRSKTPCDWAIKWIDRMRPNGQMWDVSWNIILGYSPNRRYTPILSIHQQDCITPPGKSQ